LGDLCKRYDDYRPNKKRRNSEKETLGETQMVSEKKITRFRKDVEYISNSIIDILKDGSYNVKSFVLPTNPHNLLEIKINNSYFVIEFFFNRDFGNNDPQMGIYITENDHPECIYQDYFTYPIDEESIIDSIVGEISDFINE
jgi:hypothetical protein